MSKERLSEYIFVFQLDRLKIGLLLKDVHRAIRAVAVSPLPGAPSIIRGIINLGGKVVPIVNFRKRFDLKDKPISLSNQIVIVNTSNLQFGIIVDDVIGLLELKEEDHVKSEEVMPGTGKIVDRVAINNDEMILIHNAENFLSVNEEEQLNDALQK